MTQLLINGVLKPEDEPAIVASDRSFRFGDGIFETIAVHEGLPCLWEYHLERLQGGLAALRIACATGGLLANALKLLRANAITEGVLRIHVSRGTGSRGYLPAENAMPVVIMQTMPQRERVKKTLTLWLSGYEKFSPGCLPTHFKLAQGLSSTLARIEAAENGCDDALQLGEGGVIAETSSANIFWLAGGWLYTPSLDSGALAGTTRRRIIELSPYPVSEGRYSLEEFKAAEAVIATNSVSLAMPIAGLKPQNFHWQSEALAEAVNLRLRQDRQEYLVRLRESLART